MNAGRCCFNDLGGASDDQREPKMTRIGTNSGTAVNKRHKCRKRLANSIFEVRYGQDGFQAGRIVLATPRKRTTAPRPGGSDPRRRLQVAATQEQDRHFAPVVACSQARASRCWRQGLWLLNQSLCRRISACPCRENTLSQPAFERSVCSA